LRQGASRDDRVDLTAASSLHHGRLRGQSRDEIDARDTILHASGGECRIYTLRNGQKLVVAIRDDRREA
jgi:hypothetical protein